jgi:RHS repeat-associated protein
MAIYSVYGAPTISSGTNVTPFGFQGSYTDATGEIYLIHRYYDPATDQFLSIDPDVATTGQPYVFTNDDPLNLEDALGLSGTMLAKGNVGFNAPSAPVKVGSSKTIKTIVDALKSSKVIQGLDLTGAAITSIANQLSSDMYQNGGAAISSKAADALEAMAGIGSKVSGAAGAAGAIVNISNDLAKGDSPQYAIGDAVSQLSAGTAAGAWAAVACSETGPGALACGAVGFLVGFMAASATATTYKYVFHGK